MKPTAGISQVSILTTITVLSLAALVFVLVGTTRKKHWEHPYHIVFQEIDCTDDALLNGLKTMPTPSPGASPNNKFWKMTRREDYPHPTVTPCPGSSPGAGQESDDNDATKNGIHVTQQVSFEKAKDMKKFLDAANLPH
jgi:hypothetical protein